MTRAFLFWTLLSAVIPLFVRGIPITTNQLHSNSFSGAANPLKSSLQEISAVKYPSEGSSLVRRNPGRPTRSADIRAATARDSQERTLDSLIRGVRDDGAVTRAHIELANDIVEQRGESRKKFRGRGAGRSAQAGKRTRKLGLAIKHYEENDGEPSQGTLDFLHREAGLEGDPPPIESLPKIL